MATLSLSADFLKDYNNLSKNLRTKIPKVIEIFQQSNVSQLNSLKGIHLETHVNQADPNARTIRFDSNHRGIIYDCGDNENFILTRIGTHDFTDRWMKRNKFQINPKTGAVEIVQILAAGDINDIALSLDDINPTSSTSIFSHRTEKEFQKLGIDQKWVDIIYPFDSEEKLETVLDYLPDTQAETLIELLDTNLTIEEIYTRVAGSLVNETIDSSDYATALQSPASSKHFMLLTDDDDLNEIFEKSMEEWRIFLHHTQRTLAYEKNYSGPTLVVGAAGTGKTVVAMHRAKALADIYGHSDEKRILFTTFYPSLADRVRRDLVNLGGDKLLNQVDVIGIDQLANQIATEINFDKYQKITDTQAKDIWELCINQKDTSDDYSSDFLDFHWNHFILANSCRTFDDYLQIAYVEEGKVVSKTEKAKIWRLVIAFLEILDEKQQMTYKQYVDAVAKNVNNAKYKHVIVDESQDLHQADWRLLRALVDPAPNDIFIVGDLDQRIYDNRTLLEDVDIDVKERKYVLNINYRTSKEIASWAKGILNQQSAIDDSFYTENANDCQSLSNGPSPTVNEASDGDQLLVLLISKLNKWIGDGIQPEDIVIASRSRRSHPKISAALELEGFEYSIRTASSIWERGIQVSSLHNLKGHEFRCVALFDISKGVVPDPYIQVQYEDIPDNELQRYFQRESSLLYMAATRARDDLWIGWVEAPSVLLET